MDVGRKIRRLREEKNWSQQDLAAALGESRQSVARWESGASLPEWDRLIHIALLFEISVEELTGKNQGELCRPGPEDEKQKKRKDRLLKLLKFLLFLLLLLIGFLVNRVWFHFLFRISKRF